MNTEDDKIINQMIDTILKWKHDAQNWEQTAHHLAEAINQISHTDGYQPNKQTLNAILTYNRAVRNKYRRAKLDTTREQ